MGLGIRDTIGTESSSKEITVCATTDTATNYTTTMASSPQDFIVVSYSMNDQRNLELMKAPGMVGTSNSRCRDQDAITQEVVNENQRKETLTIQGNKESFTTTNSLPFTVSQGMDSIRHDRSILSQKE